MARYRILNAVTSSLIDVFTTVTTGLPAPTSTDIFVTNSDGTISHIVGIGLALDGFNVATGGTVTSITRTSDLAATITYDIADTLNANNNSFVSFWNAADNTARFNYATSQGDDGFGSSGVDVLNLGVGDNNFTGYQGNDTFVGNSGFDFLNYASETSNSLVTPGTQGVIVNLSGSSVTATVTGGTFTVAGSSAKDAYGFTDTFSGIEGANGTHFNDAFFGDGADNQFRGNGGNDFINGGGGFDEWSAVGPTSGAQFQPSTGITVTYAAGNNQNGTVNNDGFGGTDTFISIERIRGTNFADTFNGNDANNSFRGLGGNDILNGGNGGGDEADYSQDANYGGAAGVTVNLGVGTATDGFGATDTLNSIENARGTNSADTFIGSNVNNFFRGLGGADSFDGGAGFDEVDYSSDVNFGGGAGITANLTSGTVVDGFGATDTLTNIERIRGTNFADTFNGDGNNNSFRGLGGNDVFNGGGGFDEVDYAADINYVGGTGGVVVNLATGTGTDSFGATDTFNSIEFVVGTNQADTITGNVWDNTITGNGGDDILIGGDGFDFLTPGAGTDIVNGSPGSHPDESYDDRDTVSYADNNNGVGVIVNLSNAAITETIGAGTFTVAGGTARDWSGATDTLIDIERVMGTNSADYFRGSDTSNLRQEQFRGLGGNDVINGGLGFDRVDHSRDASNGGGAGVTVNLALGTAIDGFGSTDTLISIEGAIGTNSNDSFTGDSGRNYFRPLGGNDIIDGGSGNDVIDMYVADDFVGAGATVDLSLGTATSVTGGVSSLISIEDVNGSNRDDTIIGSSDDNVLDGDTGNDTIDGGGGDDLITGGPGNNVLNGGAGTDDIVSYMYDPALAQYYNLQFPLAQVASTNQGVTVNLATGTATNWAGGTDSLTNFEDVVGTFFNDTITGDANDNGLAGLSGNDVIDGGGGNDFVYYGLFDNNGRSLTILPGLNASNPDGVIVNLSAASVTATVFDGTFTVAAGQAYDGDGGTDTLISIENIVGSSGNDRLVGSSGDNVIRGGAGADNMTGGLGIDTASYEESQGAVTVVINGAASGGDAQGDTMSGFENLTGSDFGDTLTGSTGVNTLDGRDGDDTLRGSGGNDILIGGAGNDSLNGGTEIDAMSGGSGNDSYYVDNAADTATEAVGEGSDTVYSTVSYSLQAGSEVEFLRAYTVTAGVSLTGNEFNNSIYGGSFDDTLDGGLGADSLFGNAGADIMTGGDGDDTLNGGAGADDMSGGQGNDIYYVDNGADVVTELAAGGTDQVRVSIDNYTLTANVENLSSTGTADFVGLGNAENNLMVSGVGDDILSGLAGNDTLKGNGGDDILAGGAGDDILDGGTGADLMSGGANNDTYFVDNIDDTVVETSAPGTDTVKTTLNAYALGNNVENLTFTGAGNFNGTGNSLSNVITGGTGSDSLDGGAGIDTLVGGAGNDSYFVDNFGDLITETSTGGTDTVFATASSYTLGNFVENLTFAGSGAFTGTGNTGNNTITGGASGDTLNGGAGADIINGGAGNDNLTGGTGTDTFYFRSAGSGADVITDFDSNPAGGQDFIDVSGRGFTGASIGGAITIAASGGDTLITINAVDTILLQGVNAATVTAADFVF